MRKEIVNDIERGNFCIKLFSKFVVSMRMSVVLTVLFMVLLSSNRQLNAQNVESIKWNNDVKRACQIAKVENRLVIVHFYSDCAPCNSMNANVFTDPRIAIEMNRNFVAVRVEMKAQTLLAQQHNVTVVPTDLIFNADEQVVYRRQGEISVEKYLQFLQYLRNNFLQRNLSTSYNATMPTPNTPNIVTPVPTQFPTQPEPVVIPTPHDVIAASGQLEPNKNSNTNITAAPTNNGVTTLIVPPTNSTNTDKNVTNTTSTTEPFPNNNSNNPTQPNSLNTVITKPNSQNLNTISTPTNPTLDNRIHSYIASTGHLMVEVPLAIEGYCPVVLSKKEEWLPGNPAYYAMYRGQVYRFSSQDAMEEFLKTPLKFAPVAMGEDIVMMIDKNKKICGSRKFGVWFSGRVYLFASQESLNNFIANPEYYANIAQNYEAAFKSPLDTVQR
ncbi:MAG: DUF255 domain-containing protein [Planctomycetaceae bacterium]|jgi:YHS domain-containing protein/thioredoxin-related protein|nr:DUF255 domain-containing protein [Planctomycetaceae bacterium]